MGSEDKTYLVISLIYPARKLSHSIRVCSGTSIEGSACEMEDADSQIHYELGCSLSVKDLQNE